MGPGEFCALAAALRARLCGGCPDEEWCILRDHPLMAVDFCDRAESRSAGWS